VRIAATALALALVAPVPALRAQDDVVQRAMRDEMQRSMRQLRLDTLPKPYFIAYRVDETALSQAVATVGSLLRSGEARNRLLSVELRVGDYAFDNTNYAGTPGLSGLSLGLTRILPLDDDYGAIRRQLWLATDAAYKEALEQLSRKRAALQDAMPADYVPDFSREDVTTTADDVPASLPGPGKLESLVRGVSALFREEPAIQRSSVEARAVIVRTRYVNSEGTSFTRTTPTVTVTASASTQATDGRPLFDSYQAGAGSLEELPASDSLATAVRSLGARLTRIRDVPAAEAYNGPVLFEGQAAVALFNQVFAPKLVATRRPVSDNPMAERTLAQRDNPFMDEIGARVLPRALNVTANPTLAGYEGHFAGGFRVDDDGVAARETRLVDHGILRTLLVTRVPVRGIARSTGNRRGMGVAAGTLLVTADSGASPEAMRRQLLDLAAARGRGYGIIVRHLADPSSLRLVDPATLFAAMSGEGVALAATEVVKVFPDGREEQVRNAAIGNITVQTFREIVAVSATHAVSSVPGSGFATAVVAVPALLFEDVSLRPPGGEAPKLPVLSPPWAAGP
jgi:hypothetical protein